jgi:hypothetical protein
MGRERNLGQMGLYLWGNIKRERKMVSENTYGPMELNMKANGRIMR